MNTAFNPELPGLLTAEQCADAARYMTEDGKPWDGYPGIDPGDRAYLTPDQLRERTTREVIEHDGQLVPVAFIELPRGYQEAVSPHRSSLLAPGRADTLLIPAVENPVSTGDGSDVTEDTFKESLNLGYRIFDDQGRGLPARNLGRVAQLFGLRGRHDNGTTWPLGIPFGVGGMADHRLAPVSDAVVLSNTPDGIAILANGRPVEDGSLASPVWSTIGTFGNKQDIVNGRYSPLAAAKRGVEREAGISVEELPHVILPKDHPVSGPSTLHVGLETTPVLFVHPYNSSVRPERHIPTGNDVQGTHWLNLSQLKETHQAMVYEWKQRRRNPSFPRELLWKTTGSYMLAGAELMHAFV